MEFINFSAKMSAL